MNALQQCWIFFFVITIVITNLKYYGDKKNTRRMEKTPRECSLCYPEWQMCK